MIVLEGIKNFLQLIEANWTLILVIIGLCLSLSKKIKNYMALSEEQKIEIAKEQLREMILKLVSDAEEDYLEFKQAGSIKRSQVISQIFAEFPVLSKVMEQEELIKFIDNEIDNALVTLREVIENNK